MIEITRAGVQAARDQHKAMQIPPVSMERGQSCLELTRQEGEALILHGKNPTPPGVTWHQQLWDCKHETLPESAPSLQDNWEE